MLVNIVVSLTCTAYLYWAFTEAKVVGETPTTEKETVIKAIGRFMQFTGK